jgi:hypothetical protein
MPLLRRSNSTTAAADPASDRGVRVSWTKDLAGYHAVIKELGTDRWIFTCEHSHFTVRQAVHCGRRRLAL